MRRTVHAAAAQAAAATLSMAAVQRSMAAATWNQGPGTQLQGVVEEDEDSETETGGELRTAVEAREASRFAEEQEVHQTLSHFVVGSYTQKGSLHDNEDRFSAAIWGVDPECRRASAALPAEENASAAAAAATLAADKAKAKVAQMQNEAAILGLAAGARGLGFEERGMPTPLSPRKAAGAGGVSEGGGRPQQQVLSWRGRRCVVVPPLLSDFRLAVVDPEVAGLALLEETAREAARAAANTATQTAAAVEAVLDLLVTAPPVPAMKPPAPSGPLLAALRLRRSSGGGEVEWLGVSAAWEPSLRRRRDASAADRAEKAQPAAPAAGEAGAETRSLAQVRRERLPTLVLCVCDGHDNHEAAEFVAKALPLMAYRRLPQQLALVHAEHLHAAARSLFADVEVLLRRRTGTLRRYKAPGQTSGTCVVAAVVQGHLIYTFNLGDTGALFISLDVAAAAQRKGGAGGRHSGGAAGGSSASIPTSAAADACSVASRSSSRRNSATGSLCSAVALGGGGGAGTESAASSAAGSFLSLNDATTAALGVAAAASRLCPVGSHSSLTEQGECGGSLEESGIWTFREIPFRPLPGAGSNASGAGPLAALLFAKGMQQHQQETERSSTSAQTPRAGSAHGGRPPAGAAAGASFFPSSQSAPSLKTLGAAPLSAPKRDKSFWGESELDSPLSALNAAVSAPPEGAAAAASSAAGSSLSATSSRELRVPPVGGRAGLPGTAAAVAGPSASSPHNGSGAGSPRVASRVMSVESVFSESRASEEAAFAAAGDSQSLSRSAGDVGLRFQWLSRQLRCDNAFEQQRLRALGAQILSGRVGGIIEPTRTLGDFDVKERLPPGALSIEPDIGVFKVKTQGILILACDGVWDSVNTRDVLKCMQSVKPLWKAVEAALKRETEHRIPAAHLSESRRAASASDLVSAAAAVGGASNFSLPNQLRNAASRNASQVFPPSAATATGGVPSSIRRIASWRRFVNPYGGQPKGEAAPSSSEFGVLAREDFAENAAARPPELPAAEKEETLRAEATPAAVFIEPPSSATLTALCKRIVRKAVKKGSLDDCTCVAAFITPESTQQRPP